MKVGIVDAGGGLRGIYAAGVLDFCIEQGLQFSCCIGVSAGSANMAAYLAGQKGRNYRYYTEYSQRSAYMGLGQFLRTGSYINLDYVYGTLSNSDGEDPLDYESMQKNPGELYVVATEAETGRVKYFSKDELKKDDYRAFMASSCIPAINRPYVIDGVPYFDGALSDPVPVHKGLDLGCERVVVLLSRPCDAPLKPGTDPLLARLVRRKYPKAAENLLKRAGRYNASLDLARKLSKEGRAIILAPKDIEGAGTLSKNKGALLRLYRFGLEDGEKLLPFLKNESVIH